MEAELEIFCRQDPLVKVTIYIGSSGVDLGGADLSAAVLAQAMASLHDVEIVQHDPSLTNEQLGAFAGVDLSRVRVRWVDRESDPFGHSNVPWSRYREARDWSSDLSRRCDLFVNFTHLMPAFSHAPLGVLVVLFPWFNRREVWPWKKNSSGGSSLRKQMVRTYYDWEWGKRFGTYQIKMANSHYTKRWTKVWWGIDCEVVYPPVKFQIVPSNKREIILSVGRFTTDGQGKKQSEMMRAFAEIREAHASGWEYHCVGGLSERTEDRLYFDAVQRSGTGFPVRVEANLQRPVLERLYGEAKIFWHATGYAEDEQTHPELQEHFGISTVEAMAAGCVPVVINRGAQPEIVQHGVSGFLWNTLEELKGYTLRLIQDEPLRARMAESARLRAQSFTRENFVKDFLKFCGLPDGGSSASPRPSLSA